MDEDSFDIFGSVEEPKPTQVRVSRKILKRLRDSGVRNICITDYDDMYGPYLKYFLVKKSKLFEEITNNPTFLHDLLVLSKDTKEVLLRDDRTLILLRPLDEKYLKLILVETTKAFRDSAYRLLDEFFSLVKEENISDENFVRLLEDAIERIGG